MSSTDQKIIIFLGASYAGLNATHYFLKHILPTLPNPSSYRVLLLDPSTHFYHRVAAPRATASFALMPADKLFYDTATAFSQYPSSTFAFLQAKATAWDPVARTLTVAKGPRGEDGGEVLTYHALILATGTKTHAPYLSLQGGPHDDTRAALDAFHTRLSAAKEIVVVGGGPVGVETAGEIGEYLNGAAGWFGTSPKAKKVNITLVAGQGKMLPALREAISKTAEGFLRRVGVDVIYGARMVRTEEVAGDKGGTRTKVVLDDGHTLTADLYIPAMGVTPMTEYVPSAFLTEKGYVRTNDTTLRVDGAGDRVYAVGDVASYTRGGIMDIYDAVPVVLTNIKRDLVAAATDNKELPPGGDRPYKANLTETQLVPVGRTKGVGAVFGNRLPSLMVWAIKGRDYFAGGTADMVKGSKVKKEKKWTPVDG